MLVAALFTSWELFGKRKEAHQLPSILSLNLYVVEGKCGNSLNIDG
jgi:hypothetical protein